MARFVDIFARLRPDPGPLVVAIRWTIAPELPFPEDGFSITRRDAAGASTTTRFTLPGARLGASGEWTITAADIQADLATRSQVPAGPALPAAGDAIALLPVIAFAQPQAAMAILAATLPDIALIFNNSHASDADLNRKYWRNRAPPAARVIAQAVASPDPTARQMFVDVVAHYRQRGTALLLLHSTEFGMAKFLGLGMEDVLPPGAGYDFDYNLSADWAGRAAGAFTRTFRPSTAWPPQPTAPIVTQVDSVVRYPPFKSYYAPGSNWHPTIPVKNRHFFSSFWNSAAHGPRFYPGPASQLTWDIPPLRGDDTSYLLPRDAVSWQIVRGDFGASTAGDPRVHTPPPNMPYHLCHDGDRVLRNGGGSFIDDLDLPWGEEPMEGWYAYRVGGYDLFGVAGPLSSPGVGLLQDIYAPPPPRLTIEAERIEFTGGGPAVPVTIDWTAGNEFAAPDTDEFRLYPAWTSVTFAPLVVRATQKAVSDVPGDPPDALDAVQVDVVLRTLRGDKLADADLLQLAGGRLLTSDGEFLIRAVRANSTIRVERSAGRAPPLGDASVRLAQPAEIGEPVPIKRSKAIAASVDVVSVTPLKFDLTDTDGLKVTPVAAAVHFHLLGQTFHVEPTDDQNHFVVLEPAANQAKALALLRALRNVSLAEAIAFMKGSPALVLPPHATKVQLKCPSNFAAGTLRLGISAADAKAYRGTPQRPGNEGSRNEAVISVTRIERPVGSASWVPRLWAGDPGEFTDVAIADIGWPGMTGAIRYDVERLLEPAIGLSSAASDDELLAAAAAMPDRFQRVTGAAFAPRWRDTPPGRAPTRVVYRVRGISAGGYEGPWLIVALVRVPDVRIPAPPNLLRSDAARAPERSLTVEWIQPGPHEGIGFAIETRPLGEIDADAGWKRRVDHLPGAILPDARRRFRSVVPDLKPGQWLEVRVRALRHALDPIDPRAKAVRVIEGRPSQVMRGRADGALTAPRDLKVSVDQSTQTATLTWANADAYERIEIRRKSPARWGAERVPVAGDAKIWLDDRKLDAEGEWSFQLVAIGTGDRILSDEVRLLWPPD